MRRVARGQVGLKLTTLLLARHNASSLDELRAVPPAELAWPVDLCCGFTHAAACPVGNLS
jgi:hypothetical protein